MNKIPCKKCPQCGRYNDFTIVECKCGKSMNSINVQVVDIDGIVPEQYGKINTSLKGYVQRCSACGALNYTDNPLKPVTICYNCHRTRIATIVPVEYIDNERQERTQIKSEVSSFKDNQKDENNPNRTGDNDDSDDIQWQSILENIKNVVSTTPEKQETITDPSQKLSSASSKKSITLTAIRYGSLSFTVDAGQGSYMLGRSANQGSFLMQDGRVGNEHCCLLYKNGTWYVKDNNSKNGTAVNARNIGLNGEYRLSDGDELKLGHHSDSMAFRITIS